MHARKVLILAPHTDDGELGCGATINKHVREGAEVFYVAFSICSRSLPEGWAPDTLAHEVRAATRVLGVKPDNVILFDFDVRHFPENRQPILEEMVKLKRSIEPDIVYLPSPTDIHQDHQVISQEGLRAFKTTSMLGYELPWNNVAFNTRAFNILTEPDMSAKIEALKEYKTQAGRSYFNEQFIRALGITRGVQIGVQYAEAFEVIRWFI